MPRSSFGRMKGYGRWGNDPHSYWTLVGYLQWKWVRLRGSDGLESFNDLILGHQNDRWIKRLPLNAQMLCNKRVKKVDEK
ncbi:hypothetical protein TNCV_292421 [Trichonephila clavipes]|nr:hypothetical protein TNCV_292421 [Trichonephila clavipes]